MTTRGLHSLGGLLDRTSLFSSLATSTPARCVQLSHNPSVHVYHSLKKTIEHSTTAWLREFLELDGLGSLVEAIDQLSCSQFTGFSDAILLLDCIACVRSVLNTSIGMNYFLNSDVYMRKLIKGVSTGSSLSKKHVFELMTAVCVHSSLGYHKTIDALQNFQKCTDNTSMFSVVISELKFSDTALYRTTLMSLINTVVNCTENIRMRCAIRNELIALHLLDMMHHFRREEKDADLAIQLEAFSVAKHRDDLELAKNYKLNPNNHQEVFFSLYQELLGTPASADFLNLLLDLHLMTSSNTKSNPLWKAVGKAVNHLASLSSTSEAENFITNLDAMTKPAQTSLTVTEEPVFEERTANMHALPCRLDRKDSGISVGSSGYYSCHDGTRSFQRSASGRTSGYGSMRGSGRMACISEDEMNVNSGVTRPSSLTNLRWIKVHKSKVKKDVSLWGQGTTNRLRPDAARLRSEFPEPSRLQDADDEVELLTGAQSVALNVFLSRMEMSPEEFVSYLEDGDDVRIGLPALRYLMTVLPSHDEMMQLRGYHGERYDLGQAEQFILQITDLPDYRTLLACLLFKAGFAPRYQKLKTAFTAMIKASRDILHNQGLKDFLFLVLDSGNILNQGTVFGAAGGLKLATLARLLEVRGAVASTSLLDHLIRVADAQSDEVTMFAIDMPHLPSAANHDLEELKTDVTHLSTEMRKVLSQLASTHPAVKATFEFFIEDVKHDLQQLQDAITQTRSLSQQMALYFSEDEAEFRLHVALKHINNFCEAVKHTIKEGIYARQQTARAEKRQAEIKQTNTEQTMLMLCKQADNSSAILLPQSEKIVDCLLKEVHSGHILGSLGDALQVPDLEWDPLHVSQISPSSPLDEMVEETLLSLGAMLKEEEDRPCLPDRVDDVIGEQYRKGHQVSSSSFTIDDQISETNIQGPLAVPEDTSLSGDLAPPACRPKQGPQRILQPSGFQDDGVKLKPSPARELNNTRPITKPVAHRRSASDPNESQHATKKWIKYEKRKTSEKSKPTAESQVPGAPLILRNNGHGMSKEDILSMPETVDKENIHPANKEKKKKKRSSFNLLKKISRVLKPRNSENTPIEEEITRKSDMTKKSHWISKKAVRPSVLQLNPVSENMRCTQSQLKTMSADQNTTPVETVQEEPLYKIVIYQKYQSEC